MINAVLNGIIAFFSYRTRSFIPFEEMALDILITVAIIAFINAWLAAGSARTAILKGEIKWNGSPTSQWKFTGSSALVGFLVMLVCLILFGGVVMSGLLYLLTPMGLPQWVYIVLKTLYTGVGAGLSVMLAIWAVLRSTPKNAVEVNAGWVTKREEKR